MAAKQQLPHQALLRQLFAAAIGQVNGKDAVLSALQQQPIPQPDQIIAVGKAASAMCRGALEGLGNDIPAFVVTKYQHIETALKDIPNVSTLESAHPVPDEHSLLAGKKIQEIVHSMDQDQHLLLLVSGGASSLAECLPEDYSLAALQQLTNQMLAAGYDIKAINKKRKEISRLKDGKLLAEYQGHLVTILTISDVEGDDIHDIGSGIGSPDKARCDSDLRIIASNKIARDAVAAKAIELGYDIRCNEESLYGDVFAARESIATVLHAAKPGVYIWGGEPTVQLPDNPGRGGRNQALALAIANSIAGTHRMDVLVAGTDGTDGPTDAAGGIVNGDTFRYPDRAMQALAEANAGVYLESVDALFKTGPTQTNVMDLVIALVQDA